MEKSAVIVGGGVGKRFGSSIPKQFLLLKDKPVLMYSIEAFHACDPSMEIILVLPEKFHDYWQQLCEEYHFTLFHKVVSGGRERFFSVKNGLQAVESKGVVAIHDAVRPLITPTWLQGLFAVAADKGNAVPACRAADSVRLKENDTNKAIDRNNVFLVQTPQCFQTLVLKKAYEQPYNELFTDDASVVEAAGYKINLVEGIPRNIKVTKPEDLPMVSALMTTPYRL